jgi:hypothetical protein
MLLFPSLKHECLRAALIMQEMISNSQLHVESMLELVSTASPQEILSCCQSIQNLYVENEVEPDLNCVQRNISLTQDWISVFL